MPQEQETLLGPGPTKPVPVPVYLKAHWMFFHWFGFFVGGFTFIAGTSCYFFPDWVEGGEAAGWLYVLGSCGFLTVDVMEFFTFTENKLLRTNIAMSMTGSTFYVIGSIGFIPEVYNKTPAIGEWGFILGSLFIGCSQLWKTHRIGSDPGYFKLENLWATKDAYTQVGVEFDAGLGGWCFFVGTIMYVIGPLEGAFYATILWIWLFGSIFFALGSLFLGYRHAVMRV